MSNATISDHILFSPHPLSITERHASTAYVGGIRYEAGLSQEGIASTGQKIPASKNAGSTIKGKN